MRYALLDQKKGAPLFLSIGGGITLPTGKTDRTFSTPQGTSSIPTLQTGSGSIDYIVEAGATRVLPNGRIDAHAIYKKATEGDHEYTFGDKLTWNVGYKHAVTPAWHVGLTINGESMQKHEQDGSTVEYTGGSFIYLTPDVTFKVDKHLDFSFGYAKMISRDNNYDDATSTGGLSEKHRLIFRVGYNL